MGSPSIVKTGVVSHKYASPLEQDGMENSSLVFETDLTLSSGSCKDKRVKLEMFRRLALAFAHLKRVLVAADVKSLRLDWAPHKP